MGDAGDPWAVLLDLVTLPASIDDLTVMRLAINAAVELTGSKVGYAHQLNPDGNTIELGVWSDSTHDFCDVKTYDRHYPIDAAGIWADTARTGRPQIHNDYASEPDRKGLPTGHAPVIRHLGVRAPERGQPRLLMGVGNRDEPYGDEQVQLVQRIAEAAFSRMERSRMSRRLALVTESQRDAGLLLWNYDPDSGTVTWSSTPDEEEQFELGDSELPLNDLLSMLDGTSQAEVAQALDGDDAQPEFQTVIRGRRGRQRFAFQIHGRWTTRVQGRGRIIVGTAVDVSGRDELDSIRQFMSRAALGMAVTDAQGRLVEVNPALCRMLQYSSEELEGRSLADITHPEDAEAGRQAVADLAAGLIDSFQQRKRYLNAAGDAIWSDTVLTAVRNPRTHELEHCLAQIIDVSAEVANAVALEHSVLRFRRLAENATDVVYETDSSGLIVWASPSIRTELGWDPQLVTGAKAATLLASEDLAMVNRLWAEVNAGRERTNVLTRFRTAEGGSVWMALTARPMRDSAGRVVGSIVGLRNVDSEHRARLSLEQSEAHFRAMFDNAPQAVGLAEANGRLVRVNAALGRLLDRSPERLVGARFSEFLSSDDTQALNEGVTELLTARKDRVVLEHSLVVGGYEVPVVQSVGMARVGEGSATLFIHQFCDRPATRAAEGRDRSVAPADGGSHDALVALVPEEAADPEGAWEPPQ